MMIYENEDEVRATLGKVLRRAVLDSLWDYLLEKMYVSEVLQGDLPIEDLAREYRKLAGLGTENGSSKGRPPERELPIDERLQYLSRILAKEASRHPGVQHFRQEALGGELITPTDIEGWIQRQREKDGAPTVFLTLPVPENHGVKHSEQGIWTEPPLSVTETCPGIGISRNFLDYLIEVDGEFQGRLIPIAHQGVLDQLRTTSESLTSSYGWTNGQATVFVLTGVPPLLSRGHISLNAKSRRWLNRISIVVDPTVSPKEVMETYRQYRGELLDGRYRRMSNKHLRLAEFYGGEKNGTWEELMAEWNRENPQWNCEYTSNFSRDCLSAWRRTTGEE